jgi:hypothetical protein
MDVSSFFEQWINNCIKSYINTSDLGDDIRASIAGPLFEIASGSNCQSDGSPQAMKSPWSKYLYYIFFMKQMLVRFRANIAMVFKDIRLLLRMFADIAQDEHGRIHRTEIFFLECILSPGLLNPKPYGAIPPTYQVPESSRFSIMVGLRSLIIHPSSDSQLGYLLADLHALDLDGFLAEFIDVDSNLPGLSLVS